MKNGKTIKSTEGCNRFDSRQCFWLDPSCHHPNGTQHGGGAQPPQSPLHSGGASTPPSTHQRTPVALQLILCNISLQCQASLRLHACSMRTRTTSVYSMLCSNPGLIRSLTSTFNDPRWPAKGRVPKLVIDSLMSDETAHKVKVPGATPSWLRIVQAKMKAGCRWLGVTAPLQHATIQDQQHSTTEPCPQNSANGPANGRPAAKGQHQKRKKHGARTRHSTQTNTWHVCVVRRALSWLTPDGALMTTPIICPPTPLRSTAAEYLYSTLFEHGFAGKISQCIDRLLAAVEIPCKIRALDSASDNRRWSAYEFSTLPSNVLYLVVWCTIHINHAITASGIKQMGPLMFNSLYSCSLLMVIGSNFYQLVNVVPLFVRTHCVFRASPPPVVVPVTESVGYTIMSLGYLDGQVFTKHPRGIAFLRVFQGDWFDRNVMTLHKLKNTLASFELVRPPALA